LRVAKVSFLRRFPNFISKFLKPFFSIFSILQPLSVSFLRAAKVETFVEFANFYFHFICFSFSENNPLFRLRAAKIRTVLTIANGLENIWLV